MDFGFFGFLELGESGQNVVSGTNRVENGDLGLKIGGSGAKFDSEPPGTRPAGQNSHKKYKFRGFGPLVPPGGRVPEKLK